MDKRQFLRAGVAWAGAAHLPATAFDRWSTRGTYPIGLDGGLNRDPLYRVGNYSGGFEKVLPWRAMAPSPVPLALRDSPVSDLRYPSAFGLRTPDDYLDKWPVTGLLVCRDGEILLERYRFARTASMRMTSWSMAKSVSSLLLGICLDRGLIASYDDEAQKYLPELAGTLHGGVTLRNLSNMSSGAAISHDRDNSTIYPRAFLDSGSDIASVVAGWNRRAQEQGRRFNYNELCPLTLGMVMRRVTGRSLSEFAEEVLWQPLGAQDMATWTTDSQRNEFNCVGFAATLRDWARLGTLVANRGRAGGTQVVSETWVNEFTRWGPLDAQVRHGVAMGGAGYKALMWHIKPDGSRLSFNGFHAQRVIVDMPTRTVLVQTAVDHLGGWQGELLTLFEACTRI
ncbi:MAG: serine hydrolase [Ramlibacter sp.]|jgi:CubicO group peptidase (beta-lactamase class C family)|uniref:serine hydrolase domain-containing protein n=1 Tax=Ramlibacter sp. TaxID=1917967 RepID=UPI00261E25F4|nr:serine hydrolase [Ramlibacter sp.]MDH4375936.1 serine hydrolase [Ramlibacter sp.]